MATAFKRISKKVEADVESDKSVNSDSEQDDYKVESEDEAVKS
jgi:hypothetical protein